ncbi:hypothetical protein UFOVP191_14 [uncultured Caudovirales phage]|uniref:Uncharacterized protein n=1 Tax=uncultured Caudovirales phage TaxID=2100421 RepID=A0A6J7WGC8_9CAUD|nr:hypothetical protein UFOVP191_14 [uncultured Caudovirales phage]
MTTNTKIFMPITFLLLLPFIYVSGIVYGDYIPTHHQKAKYHLSANYGKPVTLWSIASHANWTKDDKSAALRYLYD